MQDKPFLSDEELDAYYARGALINIKQLSKRSIRKAYYNWLKDDNDEREWDDVFDKKVLDHTRYWQNKRKNIPDFVPTRLGEVVLNNDKQLIFKNKYYEDLIITSKRPTVQWIKRKVRHYCNENFCEIDANILILNKKAIITTKPCL